MVAWYKDQVDGAIVDWVCGGPGVPNSVVWSLAAEALAEGRVWPRGSRALERRGQASLEAKQLSFVLLVFPSRSQCFRGHSEREVTTAGHSGLRI